MRIRAIKSEGVIDWNYVWIDNKSVWLGLIGMVWVSEYLNEGV